ncbi:MAG: bile acid:sodium symporter family protein [Desulfatibacillum sp.]|nr:bile acid:sodium symporter family protein [Desulfatibacillum sp.]
METSIITRVITPLAIFFIMFGMGLSLTVADFKRVLTSPKAMSIGVFLQIIGLPVLGFAFASVLNLPPVLAAGVMLLSACPGGAITNLVSFVSKGDAALSVSLTAVNSFITVITIPIVVTFSLGYFMGAEAAAQVNVWNLSLGIVVITIPPIIAGMWTKRKAPGFAARSEKWVRGGTILFLALLAGIASFRERQVIADNYAEFAAIAVALCLLSAFMGMVVSTAARLPRKHVLTLSIEVGLHNSAMGIVIALTFLEMNELAIFSAFYLLVEYIFSGALMAVMNSPIGAKFLRTESKGDKTAGIIVNEHSV